MKLYYEQAEEVLDGNNYSKFSAFVDQVFCRKNIGTLYFYGTGSNGKTALARAMIEQYQSTFGGPGSDARVRIFEQEYETYEHASRILIVNELPVGLNVYSPNVIHFKKKFN